MDKEEQKTRYSERAIGVSIWELQLWVMAVAVKVLKLIADEEKRNGRSRAVLCYAATGPPRIGLSKLT
jgi:hypothetical protein